MKVIEHIKKKYVIISSLMIAFTAIITFSNDLLDFWERISKPDSEPRLIQFALSDNSFGYEETTTGKFAIKKELFRTFEIKYPLNSPPSLVFLYTIQNTSNQELFVTSISYNVLEKGQVKSLTPRPLESNKLYSHSIDWKTGTQNRRLTPVYSIPPSMTGTFESEITTPTNTPLGAGIIMNIEIHTNLGSILTDTVQVYLPVSKQQPNMDAQDEYVLETDNNDFEILNANVIPKHKDMMMILENSNMKNICEQKNIDVLDIHLMFMKSSYLPFEEYKNTQFTDGTSRRFIDLFPENKLRYFYSSARLHLKRMTK